jgi:ribosome-binding factor A
VKHPSSQAGRKALQLCGQVENALHGILSGCADEVLQNVLVVSVVPAPNTGRLLITVAVSTTADVIDPTIILQHLNRANSYLRQQVATQINRRKVPELVFAVESSEVSRE